MNKLPPLHFLLVALLLALLLSALIKLLFNHLELSSSWFMLGIFVMSLLLSIDILKRARPNAFRSGPVFSTFWDILVIFLGLMLGSAIYYIPSAIGLDSFWAQLLSGFIATVSCLAVLRVLKVSNLNK